LETSLIDYVVGLKVAVRSGNTSWYGEFISISKTTATVRLENGTTPRFSRNSRFMIGSTETKYRCPYLCTVAEAKARDAEYKAATERAARAIAARSFGAPSMVP